MQMNGQHVCVLLPAYHRLGNEAVVCYTDTPIHFTDARPALE